MSWILGGACSDRPAATEPPCGALKATSSWQGSSPFSPSHARPCPTVSPRDCARLWPSFAVHPSVTLTEDRHRPSPDHRPPSPFLPCACSRYLFPTCTQPSCCAGPAGLSTLHSILPALCSTFPVSIAVTSENVTKDTVAVGSDYTTCGSPCANLVPTPFTYSQSYQEGLCQTSHCNPDPRAVARAA